MNHNCRMVKRRVAGYAAYFFCYDASPDMSFDFSLLSEVGRPFVATFEQLIDDKNLKLRVVEISERPWLITVEQ